jgi:cytochrome c oxidase subunit III
LADAGLHPSHHPALKHHFDNLAQQREASTLGMWIFLVTEILFFGGLFAAYIVYRTWYFEAFAAGSHHLDLTLGTVNTVVLIGSSLTMALAVFGAETGRQKMITIFLALTVVLGLVFLGIKAVEYSHKIEEGLLPGVGFVFHDANPQHAQIYFSLYFMMTGLHAIHMIIGIGILGTLLVLAWLGWFSPEWHSPVEVAGLYWHFVDIVWIFLFPLLYLIH